MEMQYEKPSIIEALCEFRFQPGSKNWDITVFGDFKLKVEKILNGNRETLEKVDFTIKKDESAPQIKRTPQMRFWSVDKKKLAHVSKDLVSANVLHPYPGWKEFKNFILWTLKQYKTAALPGSMERIVLRYVDRLNLPSKNFKLGEWMNCEGDYLPSSLSDITELLNYRFLRPTGENKHLGFNLRLVSSLKESVNLTIDTEAICDSTTEVEGKIPKLLDQLHSKIIETFEGSITNKFRKFLKPIRD